MVRLWQWGVGHKSPCPLSVSLCHVLPLQPPHILLELLVLLHSQCLKLTVWGPTFQSHQRHTHTHTFRNTVMHTHCSLSILVSSLAVTDQPDEVPFVHTVAPVIEILQYKFIKKTDTRFPVCRDLLSLRKSCCCQHPGWHFL